MEDRCEYSYRCMDPKQLVQSILYIYKVKFKVKLKCVWKIDPNFKFFVIKHELL